MTAIEKLFAECVAEEEHPTPPVLKMNGVKKTEGCPACSSKVPHFCSREYMTDDSRFIELMDGGDVVSARVVSWN